jgi:hypothetical protein
MRIGLLSVLLLLVLAGPARTALADETRLAGHYEGRIGSTPVMLDLRVSGAKVSGRITRAGGDISLSGTSSNGRIFGAASTSGGAGFFEAYREFGALVIVIRETGQVTDEVIEVRGEFFPAEEKSVSNPSVTIATVERDPGLRGVWTSHQFGRRGDMVLPVTTEMNLAADGSYSETSDPPEEAKQGEWRSRDGYLEFRPPDAETWSALGEYRLHGDSLITILPGSEPRVWRRNL